MKNFLIENFDNIRFLFITAILFGFVVLVFVSYVINKDNYEKIVKLYEEKFDRLPQTARLARGASLIGSPAAYHAKVGFIMGSLIFPYNRVTNHDMSIEGYTFIRNLPGYLITGFKVEAAIWFILTILISSLICIENIV
ncbi:MULTISPECIES: hypothetical protein [Citrobacter]|uniref:Uncharacterized protein n=1 Tax=Citrobacter portucalensis TaxID=1639133 RepID=A0ABZ0GYX4_9ENTR|nr:MULTISPECIES: hypothetical protein [Citrobacter]MBJ8831814.1 hypothetical protein [Citrobacter freundii]MBD9986336.1 hypothetical protein [Citrobacter portucalensis]MBE0035627.1 hypothetical protein [Citrobacter portucalensis]MBE0037513.1 hypothetical protein [Citrobacter portucalensis]MBE0045036.1 hypothetical protein [Citrobacter portucalensis]